MHLLLVSFILSRDSYQQGEYDCIDIHDFLFAILKRFQPDVTILDGIVGMEGMGPIFGQPANAKIVLASEDVVALDAIASKIMGFEPLNIPYLNIALNYRFGSRDYLTEIDIQSHLENLNFKKNTNLAHSNYNGIIIKRELS